VQVANLTARLFCAIGILTALLECEVSGEGQWVQPRCCRHKSSWDFQAARWLMEKDLATRPATTIRPA
jgi:crotonobetainyl-CoA:carnitine CoA-transferase CaiB-like acyl-CoA transferase